MGGEGREGRRGMGGVYMYPQYTVAVSSILHDADVFLLSFLVFDAHIHTESM